MRFMAGLTAAFLVTGCTSVGTSNISQTFNFNFDLVRDGWVAGAADYPVAQAATVAAFGAVQALPAPLASAKLVPYVRGTNPGGGLFLFQKRYFLGLSPASSYTISMQVEFATSYQAGCTTGPGPLTNLKAGASMIEPLTTTNAQNVVQMNIDKGANPLSGGDFISFSDIRNAIAGCPASGTFGLRTTPEKSQPTALITDAQGGFWIFIGTQSTFAGQHEVYITGLKLVVTTAN